MTVSTNFLTSSFSTRRAPSRENELEAKISRLEARVARKDQIIAEVTHSHQRKPEKRLMVGGLPVMKHVSRVRSTDCDSRPTTVHSNSFGDIPHEGPFHVGNRGLYKEFRVHLYRRTSFRHLNFARSSRREGLMEEGFEEAAGGWCRSRRGSPPAGRKAPSVHRPWPRCGVAR